MGEPWAAYLRASTLGPKPYINLKPRKFKLLRGSEPKASVTTHILEYLHIANGYIYKGARGLSKQGYKADDARGMLRMLGCSVCGQPKP